MDLYGISPFTIILVFGIISGLFALISLILSTNLSCEEYFTSHNICTISYPNYKNNNSYFDNFNIYINKMGDKYNQDKISFYLEIFLVYPFYSFTSFMKYFYETVVIFYLNPICVLLSDNIYYSLKLFIMIINVFSNIGTHLRFIGNIFSIVVYCFYLEIFVLKCFGLSKDIKRNITIRGISETRIDILNDDDSEENSSDNSQDDEQKGTEFVDLGEYSIKI